MHVYIETRFTEVSFNRFIVKYLISNVCIISNFMFQFDWLILIFYDVFKSIYFQMLNVCLLFLFFLNGQVFLFQSSYCSNISLVSVKYLLDLQIYLDFQPVIGKIFLQLIFFVFIVKHFCSLFTIDVLFIQFQIILLL